MSIEKSNDQDAFREFERVGWDRAIDGYVDVLGPVTRQTVETTLDAAAVKAGTRVLDVCTGPGYLADGATRRGAEAVGLDFADNVVDMARRQVPGAAFHQGDAQDLPFADATFDAVVCGYGIIHVPEPEKALTEMIRVVRPGGRIAVSVWEGPIPDSGFGLIYAAVGAKGTMDVALPHGPNFFQFGTEETLRDALLTVGLSDVDAATCPLNWHVASVMQILATIDTGTVRARALMEAQNEHEVAGIIGYLETALESRADSAGGFDIPCPAIVGSGLRT
ncbi:MAG: methyltransferase domain-containing protein [Alphaproteobacteria bacterium]